MFIFSNVPWMVNFKVYLQNKLVTEHKLCVQRAHQESMNCKAPVSLLGSQNFKCVFCSACRHWKKTGMKQDKGSKLTPQCVCKCRTAASDVDCCCLLRVLGSFVFSHCSWRHSLSKRTCKTLYIRRVNKPIRLKRAQSISDNTLEQTVILTQANTQGGKKIFLNLRA